MRRKVRKIAYKASIVLHSSSIGGEFVAGDGTSHFQHSTSLYRRNLTFLLSQRYRGGFLKIGNWESITKKMGGKEIEAFAELSTDKNPLHLDAEFAATTPYVTSLSNLSANTVPLSALV